ncbi:MAG: TIGR03545 family protein [candidate division KSB1 bacterium]|nr:TIGR03545 family protein [candidate division KSB1 bacterium]
MRWKGFIPFLVLVVGVAVVSLFFLDRWVESGLEKAGEAIVGARVEIDGLKVRPTALSFEWKRLQVTDPDQTMRNLIETGRAAFKMNPAALLRKRYVIEEMALEDVRYGTPRAYDGALPGRVRKKTSEPGLIDQLRAELKREIDALPLPEFDLDAITRRLNVDSLIALTGIKIVDRLDSVKTDVVSTYEKHQAFLATFRPDEDLKRVRDELLSIQPAQIRSVEELTASIEKVKNAQRTFQSLERTVVEKHREIHADVDRISGYVPQVDDWVQEDYERLLKLAKLPDLKKPELSKILLGTTVGKQVDQVLGYARLVQGLIPEKKAPKEPKRVRMKGRTIHYPSKYVYPQLLIKKVYLSGRTGAEAQGDLVRLFGEARGITNQPWVYGHPTVIDLGVLQQDKLSGTFRAMLDHTTEAAKDSFVLGLTNKSLGGLPLVASPYLPLKVEQGKADVTWVLRLKKDAFLATMDVRARGLGFQFPAVKPKDRFAALTHEVFAGLDDLTLQLRLAGGGGPTTFHLGSNLDDLLGARLRAVASRELAEAERRIMSKVYAFRDQKLAEVNAAYAQLKGQVVDRIDAYKGQAEELRAQLEAKVKELEAEVEKRKREEEEKLKQRAKKALEGVVPKRP